MAARINSVRLAKWNSSVALSNASRRLSESLNVMSFIGIQQADRIYKIIYILGYFCITIVYTASILQNLRARDSSHVRRRFLCAMLREILAFRTASSSNFPFFSPRMPKNSLNDLRISVCMFTIVESVVS